MLALALIPGLPTIPFAVLGILMILLARSVYREGELQKAEVGKKQPDGSSLSAGTAAGQAGAVTSGSPENVLPLLTVDPMEVEIGYALISMVDPGQGGDMLDRIEL